MKEVRYYILLYLFCSICIVFSSCEPSVTYDFVVQNDSNQKINILLYYSELRHNDSGEGSRNIGCIFYDRIRINGTEYRANNHSVCEIEIELKPGENLTFVQYVAESQNLDYYRAPWNYESCIMQITKGEEQLDSSFWLDMHNWKKVKDKSRYVKYTLFIN